MVMVAHNEIAGAAGRPFAGNASSARQPASLHCNNYPAAGIAGTAPSSLPPFPSSTVTSSYWAPSSTPSPMQQQHHNPWQHLQSTAPASSSVLADSGLQSGDDDLFAMLAQFAPPQSSSAPFAQLAVPQPQMHFAAQAYPSTVAPVPLAVVPPNVAASNVAAVPGTPIGAEGAKPAPQPRGRPRKNAVASSPNPPAPRRKASASNSAATSRKRARQPAAKTTNAAAAVATSGQAAPCSNPAALPAQEQLSLQSTSSNPMVAEAIGSNADTTAPSGDVGAKPAPRRRGRPRKTDAASSPKRPAPRRKASAAKSAAESPQFQLTSSDPRAWEEEAAMIEAAMGSYADTAVPGVRFQPTDEEIIGFLRLKYLGRKMPVDFFRDFNVYQAHPETVQALCSGSVDGCWYVFSPRTRRYPNGDRPARSVGEVGFWKSNTKEADITVNGVVIGKVTQLTFELGKQPKGEQTPWKMKEYSIPEKQHQPVKSSKKHKPDRPNMQIDDWVLCKIYCNNRHEDVDGTGGDQDMQIVTFEQGGQQGDLDDAARETEGDANMRIVSDEQSLSYPEVEDLCIEDYLCDPTFSYQDHAAN